MTFLELKTALEGLTPDQLAKPVIWWGDERGGEIDSLHVLADDYANCGDNFAPVSTHDGPIRECDCDAFMKAGTPVLCTV